MLSPVLSPSVVHSALSPADSNPPSSSRKSLFSHGLFSHIGRIGSLHRPNRLETFLVRIVENMYFFGKLFKFIVKTSKIVTLQFTKKSRNNVFGNRPNRLEWHGDGCQTGPSVCQGLGRIGSLILFSARGVYSAAGIGRIGSNTGRIGSNAGRIGSNPDRPNRLEKTQSVSNLEIYRLLVPEFCCSLGSLGAISALLATSSPAQC